MRWRATVGWPEKRGEVIDSRQCVPPPGLWPAWPTCCSLSSTRSTSSGSSDCRRSRILAATLIFFVHVFGQHQRLGEDEEEHQPHPAKQLEIDPVVGRVVVGHVKVQASHE